MPRAAHFGDWVALLALTLMWGTAFMFNELALASFPPSVLVAGRILIATAVLFAFMRANGIRLPPIGRAWVPLLVMAVLGNVLPFQLIAWAQQYIDSSLAGILMAVMPLFVLTLAHFLLPGSRLTPYRVVGFVVGFAGVVTIIGPEALRGLDNNTALWGAVAVLGAALSYSLNSIYARRLGATNPVQLSAGMLVAASLLSLPGAAVDVPGIVSPSVAATASLACARAAVDGAWQPFSIFAWCRAPDPPFSLSSIISFRPARYSRERCSWMSLYRHPFTWVCA